MHTDDEYSEVQMVFNYMHSRDLKKTNFYFKA